MIVTTSPRELRPPNVSRDVRPAARPLRARETRLVSRGPRPIPRARDAVALPRGQLATRGLSFYHRAMTLLVWPGRSRAASTLVLSPPSSGAVAASPAVRQIDLGGAIAVTTTAAGRRSWR